MLVGVRVQRSVIDSAQQQLTDIPTHGFVCHAAATRHFFLQADAWHPRMTGQPSISLSRSVYLRAAPHNNSTAPSQPFAFSLMIQSRGYFGLHSGQLPASLFLSFPHSADNLDHRQCAAFPTFKCPGIQFSASCGKKVPKETIAAELVPTAICYLH